MYQYKCGEYGEWENTPTPTNRRMWNLEQSGYQFRFVYNDSGDSIELKTGNLKKFVRIFGDKIKGKKQQEVSLLFLNWTRKEEERQASKKPENLFYE